VIASVSLELNAYFTSKGQMELLLSPNGSRTGACLIMAGKTQMNFKHEVPKQPAVTWPRINLTFRHIERT